jgi:hypothetical protein
MGANPAYKQMDLSGQKMIFANYPVIVAANIKNHPIAPIA